jgi:hypothetical protein
MAEFSIFSGDLLCPLHVDFVEEPPVMVPALGICGAVSEAKLGLFALCGEDRRRERNELASFRRFWAVAADRSSSLSPFGPRRRNRPSLSMRFSFVSRAFVTRYSPRRGANIAAGGLL